MVCDLDLSSACAREQASEGIEAISRGLADILGGLEAAVWMGALQRDIDACLGSRESEFGDGELEKITDLEKAAAGALGKENKREICRKRIRRGKWKVIFEGLRRDRIAESLDVRDPCT